MRRFCFILLFFYLISLFPQSLSAQQTSSKIEYSPVFIELGSILTLPGLEPNKENLDFLLLPITKEKKYKHSITPIIAFGIVGLLAGAYIGSKIDPPTHIEGEMSEILSDGEIIGLSIGAMVGGTVGYFLGKEEVKNHEE